jgi:hypothetical protein
MRFHLKIPLFIPDFICRIAVRPVLFYRRLRYGYPFRKIKLTQGKFAIVDAEDFEQLNKFKWYPEKSRRTFYAIRNEKKQGCGNKQIIVKMHRLIMNSPPDLSIDHINHNGLDNRKANLRIVSQTQNVWNARKWATKCSSRYKGVNFTKMNNKWRAKIMHKRKWFNLGYFDDEESAARAYDAKARELFGEYSCLNFPEQK